MAKNNNKIAGAVLLAAGTGLLVWGYQLYGAVGNKFARVLGGATSNETMMVLAGGIICFVLGAIMLFRK